MRTNNKQLYNEYQLLRAAREKEYRSLQIKNSKKKLAEIILLREEKQLGIGVVIIADELRAAVGTSKNLSRKIAREALLERGLISR
ncbi:MAG: hypothetical protein ACREPB_07830 [Arenimonas sp.]